MYPALSHDQYTQNGKQITEYVRGLQVQSIHNCWCGYVIYAYAYDRVRTGLNLPQYVHVCPQ